MATVSAGIAAALTIWSYKLQTFQQFFNPYQSFVTDEIARQGQMAQNQTIAAQCCASRSFWRWKRRSSKSRITKSYFTQANSWSSTSTRFSNCIRCSSTDKEQQQISWLVKL